MGRGREREDYDELEKKMLREQEVQERLTKWKEETTKTIETRLRSLCGDLSEYDVSNMLKEKYGIQLTRQSFRNYEGKNPQKPMSCLGMRVETLYYLAELFGVSTDYLLGREQDLLPAEKKEIASEVTGLSRENINRLHDEVENASDYKASLAEMVNFFSSDDSTNLIFYEQIKKFDHSKTNDELLDEILLYLKTAAYADAMQVFMGADMHLEFLSDAFGKDTITALNRFLALSGGRIVFGSELRQQLATNCIDNFRELVNRFISKTSLQISKDYKEKWGSASNAIDTEEND